MSSNIELYHCNDEKKINDFISKEEYLIISNHAADDKWAGKGMYFWDNKGNADYWHRDRISKFPNSIFLIAKANIEYNEDTLMDLTDLEIEKLCNGIIEKMESMGVIGANNRDPLGKKIDFVSSVVGFKVVKVIGHYGATPQTDYLKRSKVNNKNKIIYCVKEGNFDIISERKVLGD